MFDAEESPEETEASSAAITALIPELHSYARYRLRSKDGAQDAVQDTLEKAWRARTTFVPGASLKGWMFRILQNQIIDTFRKNAPLVEDIDGQAAGRLATPADQLRRLECADMLGAIEMLNPEIRQALLLTGAGLSHTEAAAAMGIPLGTLKSHVRRGRARLVATGV